MSLKPSPGKVMYGMHFYPGLAEYQEPGQQPYRVYLNENTLRKMDPSFAGRPIFVDHVNEVEPNKDLLRKEADGWVVESFYNAADGKHWVKMVLVSDRALEAVRSGMRLSNAYIQKAFIQGGIWNGIDYEREITEGEYDHLAIVSHPRYDESIILTPEQFKSYNEQKVLELKKLSNERENQMKFNFFKRSKVENSIDPEVCVVLPKCGKEKTLAQLINEADEMESKKDMNEGLADMAHKVKMHDGSYMNVGELMEKHKAMSDELEEMKKKNAEVKEGEVAVKETPLDSESDVKNAEEEEEKKKKMLQLDKEKNDEKQVEDAKKQNEAKQRAEAVRNAHQNHAQEAIKLSLPQDMVARGRARYGS